MERLTSRAMMMPRWFVYVFPPVFDFLFLFRPMLQSLLKPPLPSRASNLTISSMAKRCRFGVLVVFSI
jgi:hypothetical protein